MAIIKCPECGKEISDKAKACPQCGCPIKDDNIGVENPSQIKNVHKSKIQKKYLFLGGGLIFIVILAIIFTNLIKVRQEEARRESERIESEKVEKETFTDKLYIIKNELLVSGSVAESLCTLTHDVWKNASSRTFETSTDKYTISNGSFNDFNTAISNLYSADSTVQKIAYINNGKTNIKELIKELGNPPQDFEKCYDVLTEAYGSFSGLIDFATSPSGSYTEYGKGMKEKIDEFNSSYDKFETLIPDDERSHPSANIQETMDMFKKLEDKDVSEPYIDDRSTQQIIEDSQESLDNIQAYLDRLNAEKEK